MLEYAPAEIRRSPRLSAPWITSFATAVAALALSLPANQAQGQQDVPTVAVMDFNAFMMGEGGGSIALGYVPVEKGSEPAAALEGDFEIEVAGERFAAEASLRP